MRGISCLLGLLWAAAAFARRSPNPAHELAGLWEATKRFGPDLRGTLRPIAHDKDTWRGEIGGRTGPAEVEDGAVTLQLGAGQGEFLGRFDEGRTRITGHWIQPQHGHHRLNTRRPSPSTKRDGDLWRGEVVPLDDEFRFYLMIQPRADGSPRRVPAQPRAQRRRAGSTSRTWYSRAAARL